MVTRPLRCPACGAADTSTADGAGVNACAWCGSRYRVDLQGTAHVLAPVGQPSRAVLVALFVAGLLMALGVVAGALVATKTSDPGGSSDVGTPPAVSVEIPPIAPTGRPPLEAPSENPSLSLTPAPQTVQEPAAPATATFEEHHRKTRGASVWIYGIATNTSPFVVRKIEVIAVLIGADGAELGTRSGYTARDVLGPGDSSPVTVLVTDAPASQDLRFELSVSEAAYVPALASGLRIEAGAPEQHDTFGNWAVEGRVFNDGDVAARFVKVELQGWSADGKLLGYGDAYAKDTIVQPGASARFKHANQHFAEPPARFELYAEGRPVD